MDRRGRDRWRFATPYDFLIIFVRRRSRIGRPAAEEADGDPVIHKIGIAPLGVNVIARTARQADAMIQPIMNSNFRISARSAYSCGSWRRGIDVEIEDLDAMIAGGCTVQSIFNRADTGTVNTVINGVNRTRYRPCIGPAAANRMVRVVVALGQRG